MLKRGAEDVKADIDAILKRNDRVELAVIKVGPYQDDLYRLIEKMLDIAAPALKEKGLDYKAAMKDLKELITILDDNKEKGLYFASVNVDAKYERNAYILKNLSKWYARLIEDITRVKDIVDSRWEKRVLERVFEKVDSAGGLNLGEKEGLKEEFLRALEQIKE